MDHFRERANVLGEDLDRFALDRAGRVSAARLHALEDARLHIMLAGRALQRASESRARHRHHAAPAAESAHEEKPARNKASRRRAHRLH